MSSTLDNISTPHIESAIPGLDKVASTVSLKGLTRAVLLALLVSSTSACSAVVGAARLGLEGVGTVADVAVGLAKNRDVRHAAIDMLQPEFAAFSHVNEVRMAMHAVQEVERATQAWEVVDTTRQAVAAGKQMEQIGQAANAIQVAQQTAEAAQTASTAGDALVRNVIPLR